MILDILFCFIKGLSDSSGGLVKIDVWERVTKVVVLIYHQHSHLRSETAGKVIRRQ